MYGKLCLIAGVLFGLVGLIQNGLGSFVGGFMLGGLIPLVPGWMWSSRPVSCDIATAANNGGSWQRGADGGALVVLGWSFGD